jgi:predicted transcriptional regulator
MSTDDQSRSDSVEDETVVATAYVPKPQYKQWEKEAAKRSQSISSLIASMVQTGLRDIQVEDDSPSEIVDLRSRLQQVQNERDDLQQRLNAQQKQDYQVGLGKIQDLIIERPGINRREMINHVNSNIAVFVDEFLDHLEDSEFVKNDGDWYPPEEVGKR